MGPEHDVVVRIHVTVQILTQVPHFSLERQLPWHVPPRLCRYIHRACLSKAMIRNLFHVHPM